MILGALLLLVPISLALAYVVYASAPWVFAASTCGREARYFVALTNFKAAEFMQ